MSYKLLINEPMSKHTTFKAGGNARRLYVVENIDDLNEVLCICDNENTEPLVIGNGSNILVSDKGIDIPVSFCWCYAFQGGQGCSAKFSFGA